MKKRFWLRIRGLRWQEVTESEFIKAERAVGLGSEQDGDRVSGGFAIGAVDGRVTEGEITEKDYGWDPDFLKAARDKK